MALSLVVVEMFPPCVLQMVSGLLRKISESHLFSLIVSFHPQMAQRKGPKSHQKRP